MLSATAIAERGFFEQPPAGPRARSRRSVDRSAAHPRRTAARGVGQPLARLPAEKWLALVELGAGQGLRPQLLERMQPWLVSMSLMVGAAARLGYGPQWASICGWPMRLAGRASSWSRWRPWSGRSLPWLGRRGGAACRAGADDRAARGRRAWRLPRSDVARLAQRRWRGSGETARGGRRRGALAPLLEQLLAQRNHEMAARLAQLMARPGRFRGGRCGTSGWAGGLAAQLERLGFGLERLRAGRRDPPL